MEILQKPEVYQAIEKQSVKLQLGLREIFPKATVVRNASAFCVYFMDHVPRDWHYIVAHDDFDYDKRYRAALIERGIYHFPLPVKQGSVSAAHTDADIDRTMAGNICRCGTYQRIRAAIHRTARGGGR